MNLEDITQTIKELKEFEVEITKLFKEGKINGPIHLSCGNEEELIKIFREIREEDWVYSTHRSHYHALLKGIPKDWLKQEIMEGRSMHIMNKKYNFFTSSIVGGIIPIALGTALSYQLKNASNKVWAFCGDMAAETGIFHEATKYAQRHNLPITFIVEDNGVSVETPTQKVWGEYRGTNNKIIRYDYTNRYPHQGCGKDVDF